MSDLANRFLKVAQDYGVHALRIPRFAKTTIAVIVDTALVAFTFWLALLLRYGYVISISGEVLTANLIAIGLAISFFYIFGLYRVIFRYSGHHAVISIAKAVLAYGIVFAVLTIWYRFDSVPRTVGIIQPALMFFFVAGSRLLVRLFLGDDYKARIGVLNATRVIIYGANKSGQMLARSISKERNFQIICFIDDDPKLKNRWIDGRKVMDSSRIEQVLTTRSVDEIFVALHETDQQSQRKVIEKLSSFGKPVKKLPSFIDLAVGKVSISDLKPISIDDLLGRDSVSPIPDLIAQNILDQVVMVTGAGGSIGSELCRQISLQKPRLLIIVDHTESALYQISDELSEKFPKINRISLLANVANKNRMREILTDWNVNIIYHAAAYKHVPIIEENAQAGIENNFIGTWALAHLASELAIPRFVLISTDKAVRPTNIMGATKRMAEMVLQALSAENGKTVFCMVRFGNVLGSSGSVVPKFTKQIKDGGPVTLTHPDITRYFMTIPEAAQLVIQAGTMASGGEVFLLDMGEPVKILDLATRMIELSGKSVRTENRPDGDIEIRTTGLRPGEKLFEELLIAAASQPTNHPRVFQAKEPFLTLNELESEIQHATTFLNYSDLEEVKTWVRKLVPEFQAVNNSSTE